MSNVIPPTLAAIVLHGTDVGVLKRHSFQLAALMIVTLFAGCGDSRLYKTVEGHTVRDLEVSPDGKHLLIAVSETSENNYPAPLDRWSVRLCDYATGKELKRIRFAASGVTFAPDGTVALYNRREISHWNPQRDTHLTGISPSQLVEDVVWLPGSRRLISAGKGGMRLWDVGTRQMEAQWGEGDILRVGVSDDGRRLVAYQGRKGRNRNSIQVWDLPTQQVIQELEGYNYNYALAHLAISADGTTAVAGLEDGNVTVWDTETGVKRHRFGRGGKVCDLAISPDGRMILVAYGLRSGGPFTGRGENSLFLYGVDDGKRISRLAAFSDKRAISKVAFTADNQSALAVVEKEHLYRWHVSDR